MIRRFHFFVAVFLLISFFAQAEIVPLTILFQGDVHSYMTVDKNGVGGAARAAAYFKSVREKEPNVLIFNTGDYVSGTPVSTMFKGDSVYQVANKMGLDASIPGNHEFDYGWQHIERFREIANFPILCGNAFTMGTDKQLHVIGDAAYQIFTKGKLKVAALGVTLESTPDHTKKDDTEGVRFIPAITALKDMVKEVHGKCDLIVALTHVGIVSDPTIALEVEGIDLILGGHSHTRMETEQRANGVPIVHSHCKGFSIGRVDLTADTDTDRIVDFHYSLIPVDSNLGSEDPATAAEVKKWEDKVAELVDHPLRIAEQSFSQQDLVALANAAFLEATGADYSFHNPNGTRALLAQGAFSYRDIWNIFPFENTLVVAALAGRDIPEGFVGNAAIDPVKTYRIVTNSFVRDQVNRYLPTLKDVVWEDTGVGLRDAVIRYIEKRKTIDRVNLTR